jgi:DNA-binding protein HU-beta
MNNTELISRIAELTGYNKGQVKHTIETFAVISREQLVLDGEIKMQDFGKFSTKLRKAGEGRNPLTGEAIKIPAKRRVVFLAAKTLRDEMNPQPVARQRRA